MIGDWLLTTYAVIYLGNFVAVDLSYQSKVLNYILRSLEIFFIDIPLPLRYSNLSLKPPSSIPFYNYLKESAMIGDWLLTTLQSYCCTLSRCHL